MSLGEWEHNNNNLKGTARVYNVLMCPKDADGMANSVGPGEVAPGSTLFVQTYPNI